MQRSTIVWLAVALSCKKGADKEPARETPAIVLEDAAESINGVRCKAPGRDVWFDMAKAGHCAVSDGATVVLVVNGKEVSYDFGERFLPLNDEEVYAKKTRLDFSAPDGRTLVTNEAHNVLAKWLRGVAAGKSKRTGFAPVADDKAPTGKFVVLVTSTGAVRGTGFSRPYREAAVVGAAESTNKRPGPTCPMQDKTGKVVQLPTVAYDAKVTAINTASGATSTKDFRSAERCPTSAWVEQDLVGNVVDEKEQRVEPDWSAVETWLKTL